VRSEVEGLIKVWPDLVGEKIAQHAHPVDLKDGLLVIEVDGSAWHHHLFLLKGEILRKIQVHFPRIGIREIRMVTRDG